MHTAHWKSETEKLPDRGIYFLLIRCEGRRIHVGSLEYLNFPSGYYIYVGSAQRNLRKRIERHLSTHKKLRWHIDYFLQYARIIGILAVPLEKKWEEKMAMEMSRKYPYVRGFGCSDTGAPSHLFYSVTLEIAEFVESLVAQVMNEELK